MSLSQTLLRQAATDRLNRAGQGGTGLVTAVVIGRLDLADWIRHTCRFARGIEAGAARAWRAEFTRTIFLAGSPRNLAGRYRFDHICPNGQMAWLGPAPPEASQSLRRLLKLFAGPSGLPPLGPVEIGKGRPRDLYVATAGVSTAETLIHLNHLLVEAVIDGVLAPGDCLTVRQVPRLAGLDARLTRIRVAFERPSLLRAYAALTEPETEPETETEART